MELSYRGVSYDYTPNPTPQWGTPLGQGTYRGAPITVRTLKEMPAQPRVDLCWRGVPYRSSSPAAPVPEHRALAAPVPLAIATSPSPVGAPPAAAPAPIAIARPSLSERARGLFIRHHQRMRRREQAMLARLDAEVGIPVAVAAQYESQIQGKIPHDFGGYDRSPAAMS
ncbi:MAG: DUF4278 domain-containing protein [Cyanobacteria bacterium]|nr:DUF4278 domain-containing protein [Cyanobacteriota bacterium]